MRQDEAHERQYRGAVRSDVTARKDPTAKCELRQLGG